MGREEFIVNIPFFFTSVLDLDRMELIFFIGVHMVLFLYVTKTVLITHQCQLLLNCACTASSPSLFLTLSTPSPWEQARCKQEFLRGHSWNSWLKKLRRHSIPYNVTFYSKTGVGVVFPRQVFLGDWLGSSVLLGSASDCLCITWVLFFLDWLRFFVNSATP